MKAFTIHAVSKAVWLLARGIKGAQRRSGRGGKPRYYVAWPRTMSADNIKRGDMPSFTSSAQWTPMPKLKDPNPFAAMIPGMYRGFLAARKIDSMMECASLVCDAMAIRGAAHIAEFAASDAFNKLAVEILGTTDHIAKRPLSDHLLLLAASHTFVDHRTPEGAYLNHAREYAEAACDAVAKQPIVYKEDTHACD